MLFFFFGELKLFDVDRVDEVVADDSDVLFTLILISCSSQETKVSLLTILRLCDGDCIESSKVEECTKARNYQKDYCLQERKKGEHIRK